MFDCAYFLYDVSIYISDIKLQRKDYDDEYFLVVIDNYSVGVL